MTHKKDTEQIYREIMNKVIDITKIVTKEIFDINIETMLEGNEEETNKFIAKFL